MFAILVPVALAPLIVTLTWAEHRAKSLGKNPPSTYPTHASSRSPNSPHRQSIERSRSHSRSSIRSILRGAKVEQRGWKGVLEKIWKTSEQLDLVGLVLLGAAVACVLLPLTLSRGAKGGWRNRTSFSFLILSLPSFNFSLLSSLSLRLFRIPEIPR